MNRNIGFCIPASLHADTQTHARFWMQAIANQCWKWTCVASSVPNIITHKSPCLYEAITESY